MKLTEKKCWFYKYNKQYGIEVMEEIGPGNEVVWEAWLVEKDYGLKSFITGLLKKDVPTIESFLSCVLNDIENTIESFEEDKLRYEADPDDVFN